MLFLTALALNLNALYSDIQSSANTGSNVVSENNVVTENIQTNSSGGAVKVVSNVNQTDSGGQATVQVTTNTNGQESTQTITKSLPAGGTVSIHVATTTSSVVANASIGTSTPHHSWSHATSSASTTTPTFGIHSFFTAIANFFAHLGW